MPIFNRGYYIKLESLPYDTEDDNIIINKKFPFDLPSFYGAEFFYVRKASKDPGVKKDTVVFLKPCLMPEKKVIIVSATANEIIYRQYFGESSTDFYECKHARFMGRLKQYPKRSLSRSRIRLDKAQGKDPVRHLMDRFQVDEKHVITFMNGSSIECVEAKN